MLGKRREIAGTRRARALSNGQFSAQGTNERPSYASWYCLAVTQRALLRGEMPKGRKPAAALFPPPLRSLSAARRITSEFHRLTHQIEAAGGADTAAAEAELERLGGRAAYQEASKLTTARVRPASHVFSALTRWGLRPAKGEPPLPLLEVGAVNLQLSSVPWLAVRAIDIRSSHPRIEQRDFFTLRPAGAFRAVVCAMVLNCVPDAFSRGRMLLGCRAHLSLGGLFVVSVPLRCLTCSPYTTPASFTAALAVAGFEVLETRDTPKVALVVARAVAQLAPTGEHGRVRRRRAVAPGQTNDFAVAFAD